MRQGAAVLALASLLAVSGCSARIERSTRQVCGTAVDVEVQGDDVRVVRAAAPGDWRLTWHPDGADGLTSVSGPPPLEAAGTADGVARLTTPDLTCTTVVGVDPPAVRVLGDSLAYQVAAAGLGDWEGTPGAGYVQVTDDLASSALDEILGAVADGAQVLVLEFGANDALVTAGNPDPPALRAAVDAAIGRALAAAAGVPCVRVVTPSVGETAIFDLGERYVAEANRVADVLRSSAPAGSILDWTALSAGHHLPDGTDGDWFLDGDEIHPNDAGRAALVDLVEEGVDSC